MPQYDGIAAARRRPPYTLGSIAARTKAAERQIHKWRTTFPVLPRDTREHLAALLLAEDDDQAGGAQ
jgi:hypothetical protein